MANSGRSGTRAEQKADQAEQRQLAHEQAEKEREADKKAARDEKAARRAEAKLKTERLRVIREQKEREREESQKIELERLAQEKFDARERAEPEAPSTTEQNRQEKRKSDVTRKPSDKDAQANKLAGVDPRDDGEAESALKKQAGQEREDWLTHHYRANSLKKTGNLNHAIAEYELAIRLDPQNHIPRVDLAHALNLIGRRKEAIKECRRALKLKPDNPEAHHILGLVSWQPYRLKSAREHLRIASELEPENAKFLHDYRKVVRYRIYRIVFLCLGFLLMLIVAGYAYYLFKVSP